MARLIEIILFFSISSAIVHSANAESGFEQKNIEQIAASSKNVETFLSRLPKPLFENFTLVYKSRSPFSDSISFQFPRVILFSPDAKTVLTFTGDKAKPGADIVEALYFDQNKSSFVPRSYVFSAEGSRGAHLDGEVQSCTQCHGTDTRPVFDSYPLWPGFYGSVKDSFPPSVGVSVEEQGQLKKFISSSAQQGVYRFLNLKKEIGPYLDPKYIKEDSPEGDLSQFQAMPNTRLGMALTELNRKRIFRKLSQSKNYEANQKKILLNLLDCGDQPTDKEIQHITELLIDENKLRLRSLGVDENSKNKMLAMEEFKHKKSLAQIDRLASQLDLDRSDWAMALEPKSFSFFDGILSGISGDKNFYLKEDFIFEMLKNLSRSDSNYFKYFKVKSVYVTLGIPFGHRIDLERAQQACGQLHADLAQ